jgi:CheY-like chemotaxis protein
MAATSAVCLRSARPVTVLFVDDDADTRFAYRLVGTEEGLNIELAGDGLQAIAIADDLLPDVIVLDVGLAGHGLDGFEVARRLRAGSRTRTIPIVFLSGYNSPADVAAIQASGCEGHLVKPCSTETLVRLVTDLAMTRRDQASLGDTRASGT